MPRTRRPDSAGPAAEQNGNSTLKSQQPESRIPTQRGGNLAAIRAERAKAALAAARLPLRKRHPVAFWLVILFVAGPLVGLGLMVIVLGGATAALNPQGSHPVPAAPLAPNAGGPVQQVPATQQAPAPSGGTDSAMSLPEADAVLANTPYSAYQAGLSATSREADIFNWWNREMVAACQSPSLFGSTPGEAAKVAAAELMQDPSAGLAFVRRCPQLAPSGASSLASGPDNSPSPRTYSDVPVTYADGSTATVTVTETWAPTSGGHWLATIVGA